MATTKKKTQAAASAAPARKASAASRAKPRAAAKPARAKAADAATAADPAPAVQTLELPKTDKPRKIKVLRDSFTMPKTEYAVLQALKQRALDSGRAARKSEVLRAGVLALAEMGDAAFLSALAAVPAIKTGRPAKT